MSIGLIILGVVLLAFPAWVALQFLAYGLYAVLANNWHERLLWPAIVALTVAGAWALASGLAIL